MLPDRPPAKRKAPSKVAVSGATGSGTMRLQNTVGVYQLYMLIEPAPVSENTWEAAMNPRPAMVRPRHGDRLPVNRAMVAPLEAS